MTCCVCGTGVRGLEQMVDNRMTHATRHATAHARENTSSDVQNTGILNVTRIAFLSLSSNAGLSRARQRVDSSRELERAPYADFSTIFQYESFRRTFPSRNSQWSHPRTRTWRPSGVVPVRSHSETPISPLTQCRSSL